MRLKLPILFFLAAGLAGCASVNKTMDKGTGTLGELLLPLSEEVSLGKQLSADVDKQEKVLNDPEVQAWVNQLGQKIVAASGDKRKGVRYTFTVIDKPGVINAFALPGGHIYVYSGLITAARSEAELASVLGHEVGHVTERHAAKSLGTAYGLEALSTVALGKKPGTVTQIASGIAAQGYMSRHSRDAERDADTKGLDYLIRAGYDAKAMPRFFQELVRVSGKSSSLEQFFASHPDPAERAKTLEASIRSKGGAAGKTEIIGGFDRIKARLLGNTSVPASSTGAPSAPSGSGAPAPGPAPAPAPAR
ncbi:M48 family metallopeptidase [Vulgatibacter incomptus]|uniref:Putative Zn-dependent protease n=1 Tax=Vulgatibacter incomptus TaxID=1391653 RepID=A0A0K1PBE0_9BACT|nr:M48 family metallopeptidase [Vulgatibacter incomptus]AKU90444.1 Putative Zn-dependent protease [Vulgatibacter incomptus]